jgi:hypothetical protein
MKTMYLILIGIIFFSCSPTLIFERKKAVDKNEIITAVLPFNVRGNNVSGRLGNLAADELTTALFIRKNIPIIDRSQVNHMLIQQQVNNPDVMSRQKLINLADSLRAAIVVLGFIENDSDILNPENHKNKLTITVRFLSGKTGEILKIIRERSESKSNISDSLRSLILKVVEKVEKYYGTV